MPEVRRLARAAFALVSACGLVGGGKKSLVLDLRSAPEQMGEQDRRATDFENALSAH